MIFMLLKMLGAQSREYEGPDDPASDIAAQRVGIMNGNRIYLPFHNTTELGEFPDRQVRWPNDENGLDMHDNIALVIGTRVFLEQDTIPVTDPIIIQNRTDLDTLYYIQTKFRGKTETDPTGSIEWGFYPVFGYFNETSEYPAMSNRPDSWPPGGWPSRGIETKWLGEWNGRFGRGVIYADLECYFVANDAHDQEYLGTDDRVKYYPRPGIRIGDRNPGVTIQKGNPWGGIGVRVEVRGLQWNNPQARDAIFFEYTIANISDYDLPEMAFGYYMDVGIGGEFPDNDVGFFDDQLDMAYCWDNDGLGIGGLEPGIMGIAYLESPGIPFDGMDNDEDGLVDEQRDNEAIQKIGPYDGIDNLSKFLEFYNLDEADLKEHWDADEDQDWMDGNDLNGNGRYDEDENAGDDVGLDGVSPYDLNYYGPDADGTECNHRPDLLEGVGAEPNFGFTDISESDMLGLTMFELFPYFSPYIQLRYDRDFYLFITETGLNPEIFYVDNLGLTFASGVFPLPKGRTERISMAELHSYEELAGLKSPEHAAPSLFEKKQVVQIVYESDYRFAIPPKMPTLKATAGNGKVVLHWDDFAEKYTREPLLKGVNDFQGYKLYKATDKQFSDAEMLFDGFGNPIAKKPIYQCDLKDGIMGFADYGQVNGFEYYLGSDKGILHYFVDTDVQNGRTYYYAIVAYDYGIQLMDVEIAPSENNVVVDLDEDENVRFIGKNVQIVTPHQPAAGYVEPQIEITDAATVRDKGNVLPVVYDIQDVKPDHQYKVTFQTGVMDHLRVVELYRHPFDFLFTTTGFSVYDITDGEVMVYQENPEKFAHDNLLYNRTEDYWYFNTEAGVLSDVFDGMQIEIDPPQSLTSAFDPDNSGWLVGNAPVNIIVNKEESRYFPWQYDIVFKNQPDAYKSRTSNYNKIRAADNTALGPGDILLDQSFDFYVLNKTFPDENGEYEKLDLIVHDVNGDNEFNVSDDIVLAGHAVEALNRVYWGGTVFGIDLSDAEQSGAMPENDDVYRVDFKRPYFWQDSVLFTVLPAKEVDKIRLTDSMDEIRVVPNPYVATNAMEEAILNPYLNQRRKLIFTHIPAQCTIKIFTVSGVFIDAIHVDNPPEQGLVYWDLLTQEGLEIAAGMYFYHVKSHVTGDEKLGKFAVIK